MGGISYELNPLDTLKMMTASSIFGEPQYYNDGIDIKSAISQYSDLVSEYLVIKVDKTSKKTTGELMIEAINASLDYDFEKTILWAVELRKDYNMRLNPQVIMVTAALHPARVEFTKNKPGAFSRANSLIMARADEPSVQLAYYLYYTGSKNKLPSILKRTWAKRIKEMSRYEMAKYKNAELGLINTIRVCHAKGELVDELMRTGTIEVADEEKTWENLRSNGMSFMDILNTIRLPHMALLRNLRNIFKEDMNYEMAEAIMAQLKAGVEKGKQWPFRYQSALTAIEHENFAYKQLVVDTLEECVDISSELLPKLKGNTVIFSDNSGSAWGNCTSEYGSVTIAEINNLSAVITATRSDVGTVIKFGDHTKKYPISKRSGILAQARDISKGGSRDVGGSTENGIWLGLKEAIVDKIHYDTIFIYSDMQAGHGGLYGLGSSYVIDGINFQTRNKYIDVLKMIEHYRKTVNPKCNVFMVQTAGYSNALIPEFTYRGAVLYGWTGKELAFAAELIKQWDEIENRVKQ